MWTVTMSLHTRRRRGRSANWSCERSSRLRRNRINDNFPTIDLDNDQDGIILPVDLTSPEVVDLTSPNTIIGQPSGQRTRRRDHSQISDFAVIDLDSSEFADNEAVTPELRLTSDEESSPDEKRARSTASDCEIICNICLDSVRVICSSSRMVMATNCGHVFCSTCLNAVMQQQQSKCPTCRKHLSKSKIHPLYI